MLQRAASNAYSWWWASHVRTKQSKWLDNNLKGLASLSTPSNPFTYKHNTVTPGSNCSVFF
jgi:hypothetical protein